MKEYKILFTGTMGAGKTTAIGSVSEAPPIVTDVQNTDKSIAKEMTRLKKEKIKPSEADEFLLENGHAPLARTLSLYDFLKRPEVNYDILKNLGKYEGGLPPQVSEQCEIQIKYEGYIKKQIQQVESFYKLEKR